MLVPLSAHHYLLVRLKPDRSGEPNWWRRKSERQQPRYRRYRRRWSQPQAAVAFVNAGTAANPGSVSTFNITHTLTNGNMVDVVVSIRTTTATVSSITDNGTGGGSTYIFRGAVNNGTSCRVELWSTRPTGITGSPTTITVNLAGGPSKVIGTSSQYSGANALGNVSTNTGSSTGPTDSGTLVVSASSAVVTGFAAQDVATFSVSVGNQRATAVSSGGAGASNVGGAIYDNTAGVGQSATNTATLSATNAWAAVSMEMQPTALTGKLIQVAWPAPGTKGTFAVPNTAGNLIVAAARWNDQTSSLAATDTVGNTYASAVGPTNYDGANARAQVISAKNIGASPAGTTNTVTFTGPAPPFPIMFEYSGEDTTTPVDVTASAIGTSTSPNSGSATTNFANETIFGYCAQGGSLATVTAGAGFTGRVDTDANARAMAEDKDVTVAGSNNATATLSTSQPWVMLMVALKNSVQPAIDDDSFKVILTPPIDSIVSVWG